jgi:transcriptional regulator with XRE-family HTH domain
MKKELGAALRARRLELGLSQTELSKRAGVAQMTISTIETGNSAPRVDILLKLCQGLGASPNQVFQAAGLLPREGEPHGEDGFWELWGVMERLTAEERRAVIEFALFQEMRRG